MNVNVPINYRDWLSDGGAKQCYFAITSRCNASCEFCGFRSTEPFKRHDVDMVRAAAALERLAEQGVRVLSFTGGEPLLHSGLETLVRSAVGLGMMCRTGTNGWKLSEQRLDSLRAAGLSAMWFSIDSGSPDVHDGNRGRRGLFNKLARLRAHAEDIGIHIVAGVAMSRLIPDYGELLDQLAAAGYTRVTFAYPSDAMASSYRATTTDSIGQFTTQELSSLLREILQLKSTQGDHGIVITNPTVALQAMLARIDTGVSPIPCQGGRQLFYLDWDLELYPCFALPSLGSLESVELTKLEPEACDACLQQCFRDQSLYYPVLETPAAQASFLAWLELLQGPFNPFSRT